PPGRSLGYSRGIVGRALKFDTPLDPGSRRTRPRASAGGTAASPQPTADPASSYRTPRRRLRDSFEGPSTTRRIRRSAGSAWMQAFLDRHHIQGVVATLQRPARSWARKRERDGRRRWSSGHVVMGRLIGKQNRYVDRIL